MNLNEHYRCWLHMRHPDLAYVESAESVPMDATYTRLRRKKASHRGIGNRPALRELAAAAVNQDYLDEIAQLAGLEHLELEPPLTITTLARLRSPQKLQTLRIDSPRNISDFDPIVALPGLERLFIENARYLANLEWLRPLKDQLRVLGIEGSMWTAQTIASLAPLQGFSLEALFLTNTRLLDQDLTPIATMPGIRFLDSGINAPRAQFMALKEAKPNLECQWFDEAMWRGFRDPRSPRQ